MFAGFQWVNGSTTAPGAPANWLNYVFPARRIENGRYIYNSTLTAAQMLATQGDQHSYYLNGSTNSIPGLSTFWYNQDLFNWNQVERTSGIDCSGLAHRSAKYENSTYIVAANDVDKLSTGHYVGNSVPINNYQATRATPPTLQMHTGDWKLENGTATEKARDQLILSCAVPGDILVIGDFHVMIIQDLRNPDGSGVITSYNQVNLIHSTSGGRGADATWQVQHDSWEEAGSPATYELRRYR